MISALTLTEAVAANEPSFSANVAALNNRPGIVSSDVVRDLASGVLAAQVQPYETFVMGIVSIGATNGVIYSGDAPGVGELSIDLLGQTSFTTNNGVDILADGTPPAGENVLFDTLGNGLDSRLQVDDHAAITGQAGAGTPTGFVAFNDTTKAAGVLDVTLAEILAADIAVSDAQRAALQGYMTGVYRWNLPNP